MTLAELNTLTYRKPCVDSSTTISGSLGVPATFLVGWGATSTYPGSGSSYVISVPPGTHDLVAGRGSLLRDRLIIVRDLAVNASIVHPLDFDAPDAIVVEYPAVSPAGGTYESTFITGGGTAIDLGLNQARVNAVPAAAMKADDLLMVTVRGAGGGERLASIVSTRHIAHLPPSSMQLPPVLQPPATPRAFVAGTSEFIEVSWESQPTASLYVLTIGYWTMQVSPMAFAARPSIVNPDLANVPGWDPALRVPPMQSQSWRLTAESGGSLEDLLRDIPTHEQEIHSSGWAGNIGI